MIKGDTVKILQSSSGKWDNCIGTVINVLGNTRALIHVVREFTNDSFGTIWKEHAYLSFLQNHLQVIPEYSVEDCKDKLKNISSILDMYNKQTNEDKENLAIKYIKLIKDIINEK